MLEGVMMRGVTTWAVSVRKPDGEIETTTEKIEPWARRHWYCAADHPRHRRPGRIAEDRISGPWACRPTPSSTGRGGGTGRHGLGMTIFVSLAFAILLFFVIPVGLTSLIRTGLTLPFSSGWSKGSSGPRSSSVTS